MNSENLDQRPTEDPGQSEQERQQEVRRRHQFKGRPDLHQTNDKDQVGMAIVRAASIQASLTLIRIGPP